MAAVSQYYILKIFSLKWEWQYYVPYDKRCRPQYLVVCYVIFYWSIQYIHLMPHRRLQCVIKLSVHLSRALIQTKVTYLNTWPHCQYTYHSFFTQYIAYIQLLSEVTVHEGSNDSAKIRSDRSSKISRLRIGDSVPIRYRHWPSMDL